MDAISDVSRASEIFSAVPQRPPLPDPIDLDNLLGFNDISTYRDQGENCEDWNYFDVSKIFINHVDSFTGKYLVQLLTTKDFPDCKEVEKVHVKIKLNGLGEDKHGTEKEKKRKGGKSNKGERSLKSKASTKGQRKKSVGNKKRSKSPSPMRSSGDKIHENLDNLLKDEESIPYDTSDTSKLTVAEYYEMIDLESDTERETFLKETLSKYEEDIDTTHFTHVGISRTARKVNSQDIIRDYKIIGTLISSDSMVPDGVAEIVTVSQADASFVEHIVKCGIIIYIANEDKEQVAEASFVLSSILNYIDNLKQRDERIQFRLPMFILISSFMTWAFTKPLRLEEPDLPFIEKDYTKRKPHTNYRTLYDLEEQVIKALGNGEIEAVIIGCGIPYGHEEFTLKYFFENAFQLLDLPIFSCSSNNVPVVHVENISKIVKEVLTRRCDLSLPFIFAKDPMNFRLNDIVKAIGTSLGTGCYQHVPDGWAFLVDDITQDVFDQLTANIYIESCYPLFKKSDIQWKYEDGFGVDIHDVIKEFKVANNLKPLNIVIYGESLIGRREISQQLSEIYLAPSIFLDNLLQEYFITMQEEQKRIEESAPNGLKKNGRSKDDGPNDIATPLLSSTEELIECAKNNVITNQLEYFKRLNFKMPSDVNSLTDAQRISILRNKLLTDRSCIHHGYVLNGFPLSLAQARILYQTDNILDKESNETVSLPGYVICLKKVEESVDKVASEVSNALVYNEYRPSRLSWFKEEPQIETEEIVSADEAVLINIDGTNNILDSQTFNVEKAMIDLLMEQNPDCKCIEIAVNVGNSEAVLRQILTFIEGDVVAADELINKISRKSIVKEKETKNSLKNQTNSSCENSSPPDDSLIKLKKAEEVILAVRSYPLLKYLINYIYPTLTNAILEVCEIRPDDPLDFIAEYLFRHNPDGRMPGPKETEIAEKGFPNQDKEPRMCHSLFLCNSVNLSKKPSQD